MTSFNVQPDEPKTQRINIPVTASFKKKFSDAAHKLGFTEYTVFARKILAGYLDAHGQKGCTASETKPLKNGDA